GPVLPAGLRGAGTTRQAGGRRVGRPATGGRISATGHERVTYPFGPAGWVSTAWSSRANPGSHLQSDVTNQTPAGTRKAVRRATHDPCGNLHRRPDVDSSD